jgi:hypothetical protein
VPCKDSPVYYGSKERMFQTMETKEYFDLDLIMYYINTCTALILSTCTQVLLAKGYRRLLLVRVDTDTRFKPYDRE